MRPTKILLVEDDDDNRTLIIAHLARDGYDISDFDNAEAALNDIRKVGLPHLALVDLHLPGMDGLEFSAQLKMMADVPIIMITGDKDTKIIVKALRNYAEDFIVKPFDLDELSARIAVVLARMPSLDYATAPIIHVDDRLSIDFANHRLIIDGITKTITATESTLLYTLMRTPGRVVENRLLIARVWGDEIRFEKTLRVHMHRLRKKMEIDPHLPAYIETERGIGYKFRMRPKNNSPIEDH